MASPCIATNTRLKSPIMGVFIFGLVFDQLELGLRVARCGLMVQKQKTRTI